MARKDTSLSLTPMHNDTVVERNETDQEKSKLIFLFHRLAELCARRPERSACPQAKFDGCTVQRRGTKNTLPTSRLVAATTHHVDTGDAYHEKATLETPPDTR